MFAAAGKAASPQDRWPGKRRPVSTGARLLLWVSIVAIDVGCDAGPSSATNLSLASNMMSAAQRPVDDLASKIKKSSETAKQMLNQLGGGAPPKGPAAADAAGPMTSATDGSQRLQSIDLQQAIENYSKAQDLIGQVTKKIGQSQGAISKNSGGGGAAPASGSTPTPAEAELISLSDSAARLANAASSIRDEANQIEASRKAAIKKFETTLDAASAALASGLVTGFSPSLTEAISRNDNAGYRASLQSANIMEVLFLIFAESIRETQEDKRYYLEKLKSESDALRRAAERTKLAVDIAHTQMSIAYLSKLIDTNGRGSVGPFGDLFTVMLEYQKLIAKEAREDRERALEDQKLQSQQARAARDMAKLQEQLLHAKSMKQVKHLQSEIQQLQSISADIKAKIVKTVNHVESVALPLDPDLTRIPSKEELEAWQRMLELKKRLTQQKVAKNKLIDAANATINQIAALEAQADNLAGDCDRARQAVNAMIAAAAAAAQKSLPGGRSGNWFMDRRCDRRPSRRRDRHRCRRPGREFGWRSPHRRCCGRRRRDARSLQRVGADPSADRRVAAATRWHPKRACESGKRHQGDNASDRGAK